MADELTTTRQQNTAMVETQVSREIQEVQAMILVARKFPRDEKAAIARMKKACERPAFAEAALYEYSKGGTPVTGLSIRAAEMMAQNWGNVQTGVREIEQRQGESTVEAFCWDLESNTRVVKIFQVPHTRYSKANGNTKLTDPRDIYERIANDGARRQRACITGCIPEYVGDELKFICEETLMHSVKIDAETIGALVKAFEVFKVTRAMLEKKIQKNMNDITPKLWIRLRKIYNSLKDGMSTPADWFEGAIGTVFKKPETDGSAAQ